MKRIKNPGSVLQIARLFRPKEEAVKVEVLRLLRAAPPFSYDDLYRMVWDYVRGLASKEQVEAGIQRIGQKLKRESYQRAFAPTAAYFAGLERSFEMLVEPRTYPLARNIRVPCAPPMICGTGQGLLVPWPMFWKKNPLNEEQTALFMSMAMDVMERDSELDEAQLVVVDTSTAALDKEGHPKQIFGSEIRRISPDKMEQMVGVFLRGYSLAVEEWNSSRRARTEVGKDQDDDQMAFVI